MKKQYNVVFKIGDKVRIEGSSTIGVIDNIEKNNAVVNYDTFKTKTNISKLEFVKWIWILTKLFISMEFVVCAIGL